MRPAVAGVIKLLVRVPGWLFAVMLVLLLAASFAADARPPRPIVKPAPAATERYLDEADARARQQGWTVSERVYVGSYAADGQSWVFYVVRVGPPGGDARRVTLAFTLEGDQIVGVE